MLGLAPGVAVALLLIAAAGIGRVVMDVAGRTLLQRVAPDRTRARIFGVLEGLQMAALAVGSVLAPLLILVAGDQGAFVIAGAAVRRRRAPALAAARRMDGVGVARPRELELLRALPIFAPLGPVALERLAANLVPVHAHAGSVSPGRDRGSLLHRGPRQGGIEVDGHHVREQGAGESFGEIALLRNVPRTATVRALESSELLALERGAFLEAVTGQPASRSAAEAVVARAPRHRRGGGRCARVTWAS